MIQEHLKGYCIDNHCLSTVVLNLQLHVKPNIGETIPDNFMMGDFAYYDEFDTGYRIYDIGTVQLGQSRDIILKTNFQLCVIKTW